MAEASRARVTITLGRSGQVVKREASASDISFNDSMPAVGTKRSVRDRLGSSSSGDGYVGNGSLYNGSIKRQRGDNGTPSFRANGLGDLRISKDDLRLKLMRKNASRRAHSNDDQKYGDLRDKLTKAVRPSMPSLDSRQRLPQPKETGDYGRLPSTRSADDLLKTGYLRNSYSPWTDHVRRRSPDRMPSTSRGLSPQRNLEKIQRTPLTRTLDDGRSVQYMSKDVIGTARPMGTVAFTPNSALPPGSVKPVAPHMSQLPPPSGIVPKSSYMVDEQQTVDGLLHALGLKKYALLFKAEEVDMTALKQMGENDLKELGIPMGPRKKILLALLPRSKRQP
ncbi:Mitogen-activated protein kinase kinase kinase [Parasponia andersonii]|uniref:Mitogen-activated protein kinase kinase kinase n=1 Tax=Parasponia andersonii TaxID=3476 RepID=A0A2P5BCQ2_PARAD|nr:Mitogen-activated protein kinase kinase kinase [Parasponia andersonii]